MATRSYRTIHRLLITVITGSLVISVPGFAAADPAITTLENELAETTAEFDAIVEDYNRIADEIVEVEQRYEDLLTATDRLRDDAETLEAEVSDVTAVLYHSGTATALLTGTPDALADRLSVLNYLGGHHSRSLARLAETSAALRDDLLAMDLLDDRLHELADLKADKETQVAQAMTQLDLAQSAAHPVGSHIAPPPIPGGDAGVAGVAVAFAHGVLGAPYEWGGTGPGYDCSGLTSAAWGSAGVHLPHSSQGQYDAVARIDRDRLQPGDLVFYYDDLHHVAMYVGDGKIIHAPSAGQTVQVAPIDQMPIHSFGRPF